MLRGPGPRVLVAGGLRGHVGRAVSRNLSRKDWQVEPVTSAPLTLVGHTWKEVSDPFAWQMNKPRPVDHVLNLSGRAIFSPTYWHYQLQGDVIDKRIESNEILRDLIVGAKQAPKSFLHISSTGVYGNTRDEQVESDEALPSAHSWWADTCRRWEAAAALPEGHATRRVTLRTGVVLGNEGGVLHLARRAVKAVRFVPELSDGKVPLAWIHIDDLVGLVHHILTHDSVSGVVHAVAPSAAGTTHGDLHSQLVKRTQASTGRIPDAVLDFTLNEARAQLLRQGQRVGASRKAQESGYRFKFSSLNEALDDLMAKPLPDPNEVVNPNYQFLDESKRPTHPPMQVHDHH